MLLPREQNPWNCAYYLGAIALQALRQAPNRTCDLLELQQKMSRIINRPVSPMQVTSAAAWLFLVDAIRLDDNGIISDATK
ncbi:MAG: ABC-three component system middle component 6 [Terriglobales bacterium]